MVSRYPRTPKHNKKERLLLSFRRRGKSKIGFVRAMLLTILHLLSVDASNKRWSWQNRRRKKGSWKNVSKQSWRKTQMRSKKTFAKRC